MWESEQLFNQKIQAWASGPVVPELYQAHKGQFKISKLSRGKVNKLTPDEIDTIDCVLSYYGNESAQWLSDLSHSEDPWKNARKGIPDGEQCTNEITLASLEEYYGAL